MSYKINFENWKKNLDDELLLQELTDISFDEVELENRFSNYLQFGTAGLRGVLGVGTNNVNIYTISKTTQGLANYMKKMHTKPSVVIAFDNRKFSYEFSRLVANIFLKNNVKVYLFDKLTPTPILSYAVRKFGASMGVNITSSHNSKQYNGYKVLNSYGLQIGTNEASSITHEISLIDEFKVKTMNSEQFLIHKKLVMLDESVTQEFVLQTKNYLFDYDFDKENFNIIYTPLNGTGKLSVMSALELVGFKNIKIPQVQENPDSQFTTVPNPNPELEEVYEHSLLLAHSFKADVILATDPDCDRLGVMVLHNGKYVKLTGDEVGILLLHYILKQKSSLGQLNKNSFLVSSVVSSSLVNEIAKAFKVQSVRTLTGFKNIALEVEKNIDLNFKKLYNKKIKLLKEQNKAPFVAKKDLILFEKQANDSFVMAYEEACGYMVSSNIREKDGITPLVLLALISAKLKLQNKTIVDYLNEIYNEFGFMVSYSVSKTFIGIKGKSKINDIVHKFRHYNKKTIAGLKIVGVVDYDNEKVTKLEKSNFVEFNLQDGSKLIIRPSGTEPKIKAYILAYDKTKKLAHKKASMLEKFVFKNFK